MNTSQGDMKNINFTFQKKIFSWGCCQTSIGSDQDAMNLKALYKASVLLNHCQAFLCQSLDPSKNIINIGS
jgi:hypothetical protein